ncbi:hypothetical protein L7F22_032370 [Adiantum nelumboides]|nr:hypothetical protein [Adiantum nelumboides]
MMEKVAEDESMEAMMGAIFQVEDDDDEEIKQLQAHIQTLAAKAQEYSSHGPGLISSRLQSYLQNRRPLFTPDPSELLPGCQDIFTSGCMPPSLCSGLISLIPKGGDTTRLRQWRPITLLSSVYKILAKLISSLLRPYLPDLIHTSQIGFV